MKKAADDFMVCLCRKTTKAEVMRMIRENDIHDLKTLRETCNIGNKCGACAEDLESLIAMVWEEKA